MLSKCISKNQRDWNEHLSYIAFFYNASVNESTGFSPYFIMHGFEPRWDIDFKLGTLEREPYSVNDYADVLVNRLEEAHELVREQLRVTANRMKEWYDKKVHSVNFNVGDEVFVLNLRLYPGRCHKWTRRYTDVAEVVEKINDVTYVVKCNKWKIRTKIVHVDKLKLRSRGGESAPASGQ